MGFLLKRFVEWRARQRQEWEQFRERGRQLDAEWQNVINPLPLDKAQQRAATLLADPTQFECKIAPETPDPRLAPLAPALRGFFERYDRVEQIPYGVVIARDLIEPSEAGLGLIRIGEPDSEHVELSVRPNEETVYEVDLEGRVYEDEADLRELGVYSSIYHCVIYYYREKTLLFGPDL